MERGCRGILKGDPVDHSPLRGLEQEDVWVTATKSVFRDHLKHVAARMPPHWGFLVVSDANLMDAWLSPRLDVMDADVAAARMQTQAGGFHALVDIVEPPQLLIIIAGIKSARNEAMPEVLLEAIRHRMYRDTPTWVVDQPDVPLTDSTHLSHSKLVLSELNGWNRAVLGEDSGVKKSKLQLGLGGVELPPMESVEDVLDGFDEAEVEEYVPPPEPSKSTAGQTLMGQSDKTQNLLGDIEAETAPPQPKKWRRGKK